MESSQSAAAYRQQLIDLYDRHDPEKLGKVDELLQRFAGHEEALLRTIERKYAERTPSRDTLNLIAQRGRTSESQPSQEREAPQHSPPSPVPSPAADEHNGASASPSSVSRRESAPSPASYYARLTRLYEAHAPLRVSRVHHELEKYQGREEELIQAAVTRFGPEPPAPPAPRTPLTIPAISPSEMSEVTMGTSASPTSSIFSASPVNDYRSRAVDLYLRYDPSKTHKVDAQLARFKGKEEGFLRALEKKLREGKSTTAAVVADTQTDGAVAAGAVNASPPPSVESSVLQDDRDNAGMGDYTQRLVRIYELYAPDRAHRAARQLQRYPGREEEVIQAAVEKYGPEPQEEAAAAEVKAQEEAAAAAEAKAQGEAAAAQAKAQEEAAAAAEAKAQEEAAAAQAKAQEEAAAAAEARAQEEAAAAAEAKAQEEAAAAAEAKAQEEAAAAAEAKAQEEAAAAAEAKAQEEAAAAAEAKAQEEAAAAQAKAQEEAAAAAEAKAQEEAAAAAEAKAQEEAAAAAEAKAQEEAAASVDTQRNAELAEYVEASTEVAAVSLFPTSRPASMCTPSKSMVVAASSSSSAAEDSAGDSCTVAAAVATCLAHTPLFPLAFFDFFRALGTAAPVAGREVISTRVAAILLRAIDPHFAPFADLAQRETASIEDGEAWVTEEELRVCIVQWCTHEAEGGRRTKNERAVRAVHTAVRRMNSFVKTCRLSVVRLQQAPSPLSAGFWVHRSIQPRVVQRWRRCWAKTSAEKDALCLYAPGTVKEDLHVSFARVVRCGRDGRAAGAPPLFARNGLSFQLTAGNPPLHLIVCPESSQVCEALLSCFRAWHEAAERTAETTAFEHTSAASADTSLLPAVSRLSNGAPRGGVGLTVRVWAYDKEVGGYERQAWRVEEDMLHVSSAARDVVQTLSLADIATVVGEVELPVPPPSRSACGFVLCRRNGSSIFAFTEHPQERAHVLERVYQSQLLLELGAG